MFVCLFVCLFLFVASLHNLTTDRMRKDGRSIAMGVVSISANV